ncbi:MAG: hypothetical protein NTW28_35195 [Candidatus Solibacter sp.]|nr:hypothetical protein [Candidatus Solibacter sp.]
MAKLLGTAEPAAVADLPAVVLSLVNLRRPASGLGERSILMVGALQWTAKIDLADPVLAGTPPFTLLSIDRRTLQLPHGGLVRSDGTSGAATPADIQVSVAGQARTLVVANPQGDQFQADLLAGTLRFGAALPAAGAVEATYFVGQWEQRVARLEGDLEALVLGGDVTAVGDLSASLMAAGLAAPANVPGVSSVSVTELGFVAVNGNTAVAARQRLVRFHFEYELELNLPDSSGGVIREIPVTEILV